MNFSFSFNYNKYEPLFNGFALDVPEGRITVVCGHNGAGKTTLLKVICGILPSDMIGICGWFVPATGGLITHFSLKEHLRLLKAENKEICRRAIAAFGAEAFIRKPVRKLSTGQSMMASLIVALAANERLLLLDEPFASLDPVNASKLVELLKGFGKTVIATSHDLFLTKEVADNIVFIRNGVVSWRSDELEGITAESLMERYKEFS